MLTDAEFTTVTRWSTLHGQPRHRLRYPSEHVVRWLANMNLARPSHEPYFGVALDIGCGAGRHSELLADAGFRVCSVDASPEAVALTREIMGRTTHGQFVADMRRLPFTDGQFAVAVAYGVFYYGSVLDLELAVSELWRVLARRGRALVNLRDANDWRAKHIRRGVFEYPGEPEDGMAMTLVGRGWLEELFDSFREVRVDHAVFTSDGGSRINSEWIVSVQK